MGVENRNTIPDARMTASTFYNSQYHHYNGRLKETKGWGAWGPKTNSDRTDYLQVHMGALHSVCAVATQGANGADQWTTSYKLRLSINEVTWHTFKENNVEKVRKS